MTVTLKVTVTSATHNKKGQGVQGLLLYHPTLILHQTYHFSERRCRLLSVFEGAKESREVGEVTHPAGMERTLGVPLGFVAGDNILSI